MGEGRTVVLLGPQREEPGAGSALSELGVSGRVALVTAGWQEREPEDKDLIASLGVEAVNLRLHMRSEEVFFHDKELATAYKARQALLRHLQEFYRIRLDHADEAARAIGVRHVEPELIAQEWAVSVDQLRGLDRDHLERCTAIHREFEQRWQPTTRERVASQRAELAELIEPTEALVVAGGHVASLLNRMRLFDVVGLTGSRPVVAWSAGAMIMTERVVLFHDFPPYGKDTAQVLDAGFGLAPDLVALPDPKRRIRLDDREGIARFAQRMAPATCLAMDAGAQVVFEGGRRLRVHADRLTREGEIERGWSG